MTTATLPHPPSFFGRLTATTNDHILLVVRLVLGTVMFAHGAQKALGWFGGYGFQGTMGFMTQTLHIPVALGVLAIAAEFLGGLGLLVGLFTRLAALGVAVNMIVAVLTVHLPIGFFMNWGGTNKGEGYEYHLLALGLALILAVRGGGALSLDRALTRQ